MQKIFFSNRGRFDVVSSNDVAHDHEVGVVVEVLGGVGRSDVDAPFLELVAHGGINVLVTAADRVAVCLEQPRERPHASARHP